MNLITCAAAEEKILSAVYGAAELIRDITGVFMAPEEILTELSDCEWIFDGGTDENDEDLIDLDQALIQLSYIVERNIEYIQEEKAG
jgi:hypothetical protein